MSFKAAVGVTPSQVLFGTQADLVTVVNTGAATAYVSDSSDVNAGGDLALDVGGSLIIAPGAALWAVCDPGQSTTLSLVNAFGQRFAYGQSVARSLGTTAGGATNATGVVAYDETAGSQFSAVSVSVRFASGAATAGDYVLRFAANAVQPGVTYPGTSSGVGMWYESVVSLSASGVLAANSLLPMFGVVVPVNGYGGVWTVTPPSGTPANSYTVDVVGLSQAPAQAMTWTALTTDTTNQMTRYGNTYNLSSFTLAASSTLNVQLPVVNGPVRIAVQYTQTGAGASSATPRMTVSQFGPPTTYTTQPFDTAIASSSIAGSVTGYATYAVWPVTPTFIRFTTAAGVSLSAIQVTLIAGTL